MRIVWDEPKRQSNLVKHGMDFATIGPEFFEDALVGTAKDGRLSAIGELDGIVTVIFMQLGSEALSVISLRPASVKERKAYAEGF
jgi:uncharacterized DUF497 family protein